MNKLKEIAFNVLVVCLGGMLVLFIVAGVVALPFGVSAILATPIAWYVCGECWREMLYYGVILSLFGASAMLMWSWVDER